MRFIRLHLIAALALALGLGGCRESSSCTPGKTESCACAGGGTGVQTCQSDYTYGACDCGGGSGQLDGGSSVPGGPVFLSFGTSATRFTQGQSVTFTAVLTDPDGIEDLIGGSLKSGDGQTTFGAFVTSAQEGAYSFELTWDKLNTAVGITFEQEREYTFVAEFYDAGGKTATRPAVVRTYCDLGAACTGTCVDLQVSDDHCGSCGNACKGAGGNIAGCQAGRCEFLSDCTPTPTTCQAVCAAEGGVCDGSTLKVFQYTELGCGGTTTWDNASCTTTFPNLGWPARAIECSCRDPL